MYMYNTFTCIIHVHVQYKSTQLIMYMYTNYIGINMYDINQHSYMGGGGRDGTL